MIYGVYPESWAVDIEKIPDAEQANGIGFANSPGNGFFTYPAINSVVWCFFANEDQNHPVYFATCQGGNASFEIYSDGNGTLLTEKNNVNKIVFGGLDITFNNGAECSHSINELKEESDSKSPSIKITSSYGKNKESYIEIDSSGTITVNSCNDININSANNMNMNVNKNLTITVGNQINMTADNNIFIESSYSGIQLLTNSMTGFIKLLSSTSFKWF
jgi:hypothetical protein